MSEDTFRNTITLTDAARMTGPSVFNIMIKPCGSVCNLDCRYCYYLDKASLYGGHEPKMSDELLEKVIKDYAESVDMPEITFNWHGGEPLVAGIDFYRKAVELERKYCGDKLINNTLQTNGTLVDSRWARTSSLRTDFWWVSPSTVLRTCMTGSGAASPESLLFAVLWAVCWRFVALAWNSTR